MHQIAHSLSKRHDYHHGDLRSAIVRAAIELIDEQGLDGFTLTDASRKAGVAKSAPYRHFKNKEAILVAVASHGFNRFEASLRTARSDAEKEPAAALGRVLGAYVDMALHHPAEFRAMFAAGICKADHQDLADKAEATFQHLKDSIAMCESHGMRLSTDLHDVSIQFWIAVHGIAMLAIDGSIQKLGGAAGVTRMLDNLIRAHVFAVK